MKIAFTSDIHLEFREKGPANKLFFQPYGRLLLPKTLDGVDVIVFAGDIHNANSGVAENFKKACEDHYGKPVIMVRGNHDYYSGEFPTPESDANDPFHGITTIDGVRFVHTTLWSYLPPTMTIIEARQFADFEWINNITIDKYNAIHEHQLGLIKASDADVVITHHSPCNKSIQPRYANDSWNCFFANNYDPYLLCPSAKLWIHGHIHWTHTYQIDTLTVSNNAHGYPHEYEGKVQFSCIEI